MTQQCLRVFDGHESSIKSVMQSYDTPEVFVSCGRDGKIIFWDTRVKKASGKYFEITNAHTISVLQTKKKTRKSITPVNLISVKFLIERVRMLVPLPMFRFYLGSRIWSYPQVQMGKISNDYEFHYNWIEKMFKNLGYEKYIFLQTTTCWLFSTLSILGAFIWLSINCNLLKWRLHICIMSQ